ncbi:hypothetical protein Trydic_g19409 [Trypoxylus dichotomus]
MALCKHVPSRVPPGREHATAKWDVRKSSAGRRVELLIKQEDKAPEQRDVMYSPASIINADGDEDSSELTVQG